jgi:hypothetical protein
VYTNTFAVKSSVKSQTSQIKTILLGYNHDNEIIDLVTHVSFSRFNPKSQQPLRAEEIKDINLQLPLVFLNNICVGGYNEFQDLVDNMVVDDIISEGSKETQG